MKDLKKIRQHGPILKRRSNTQNKRKLEKKRTINRLTEVETPELIEVIGLYRSAVKLKAYMKTVMLITVVIAGLMAEFYVQLVMNIITIVKQ